jgi:hypothetical protein
MNLTQQSKLTRAEWENIEIPVSSKEKQILMMIIAGYSNTNIHVNENQSLFSFVKIENTEATEQFLFKKYFEASIQQVLTKYAANTPLATYVLSPAAGGGPLKSFKSADMIRIQNLDANINQNREIIFEYFLIELATHLLKQIQKRKQKYAFYLYTLLQIKKSSIPLVNRHVVAFVDAAIDYANSLTKTSEIITNAYEFIEKNTYLLKYEDKTLFKHQKELFSICKQNPEIPKLILYTAPTGTGKTLSPIGLSEKSRILFVCVARHIGLALAKSAISVEKKVAFAFGCETASDIRLHYFSAVNYSKNRRSGGIGKVDNSVGDNVEIMICDVQSYLTSMHYMLAFNPAENIITYWDEPTITMDYETHPLHEVIKRNWKENRIPTMVLSCATLPTMEELQPVFDSFRDKFDNAEIHSITSYDCRKSIPILNKDGYTVLPHYLYSDYADVIKCAHYCMENKTLLRYFDLREIVRFVEYVNECEAGDEDENTSPYSIDSYFGGKIENITMNSLKEYYLVLLEHLDKEMWPNIHKYMMWSRKPRYSGGGDGGASLLKKMKSFDGTTTATSSPPTTASSGILLTTKDAYTLTDGPTLFLAEDVSKIGTFYIQQTNIAPTVFQMILQRITNNAKLIERIEHLEKLILAKETKKSDSDDDSKKGSSSSKDKSSSDKMCKESNAWMAEIDKIRKEIRMVSLDPVYVPNTRNHQEIWTPTKEVYENAFVSNIGEETAKEIMSLNIENSMKVLLLLGIGVFQETTCGGGGGAPATAAAAKTPKYMEIMKQLADEQRLFMIVASSDYIYGTNYQFCHGMIGKDLKQMTQQKTIQAMGRIGRNHIQQDYTIRFRDDDMIMRLFEKPSENREAMNMCMLFE